MTRERKEISPTFAVSPGCSAVTLWVAVARPHPSRCAKQKYNCRQQQPAPAWEGSEGKRSGALPTGTTFHAAPAPGSSMDLTLFLSVFMWVYVYIYICIHPYVCTSAGFGVLWELPPWESCLLRGCCRPSSLPHWQCWRDWGAWHLAVPG